MIEDKLNDAIIFLLRGYGIYSNENDIYRRGEQFNDLMGFCIYSFADQLTIMCHHNDYMNKICNYNGCPIIKTLCKVLDEICKYPERPNKCPYFKRKKI